MKYQLLRSKTNDEKCFLIIGGFGDKGEDYLELVELLQHRFPALSFCTNTLTQTQNSIDELLEKQTKEVEEIASSLIEQEKFKKLIVYTTSMGAYATTKLVVNPKYSKFIEKAIYFDPADFYQNGNIKKANGNASWPGFEEYSPSSPTVSELLSTISSSTLVDVAHFSIKNYSHSGYIESDFGKRGIGVDSGFPRLSRDMVKHFYDSTKSQNRGRFVENSDLPHGYFVYGDLEKNLEILFTQISNLLS